MKLPIYRHDDDDDFKDFEGPDPVDDRFRWPRERKFRGPEDGTIPAGPYQTSARITPLDEDFLTLHQAIRERLSTMREHKLFAEQRPPNAIAVRGTALRAEDARRALIRLLEKMRDRTRGGFYLRNGSGPKDIARTTCNLRALGHLMCDPRDRRIPTPDWLKDEPTRVAYCQLIFWLRGSRGAYAKVDCSRL
jgi:hypothetical protein